MKVKLGFFPYTPLDYKAAQDYLDRKVAQGWVLESLLPGGLAEFVPALGRRHYVDVCALLSFGADYDLLQLCDDAGWERVAQRNDMVIFRSKPGVEPRPIQSDPAFEWKEFVRKRVLRQLICHALILLLLLAGAAIRFSYWTGYHLTLLQTVLAYRPLLVFAALLLPIWLWNLGHLIRYLSRCRAASAMAPQPWLPSYLRSTLSYFFTLLALILFCVVLTLAFH